MPDEKRGDDVEQFLTEQKVLEDRKQALIAGSGKPKRSHHKKTAPGTAADTRPKSKTKS